MEASWPSPRPTLFPSPSIPTAGATSPSCRDTDPDLFFPVGTTGPAIEQIDAAKAVCDQCQAKEPCLEFALTTNQDSGVWGGTSEEERRKLRRQWLAAKRRASASA